jgi:hypothetical protein
VSIRSLRREFEDIRATVARDDGVRPKVVVEFKEERLPGETEADFLGRNGYRTMADTNEMIFVCSHEPKSIDCQPYCRCAVKDAYTASLKPAARKKPPGRRREA